MDFSKCKYCGSRADVFYMFGEPVCYDCAIELLKENEDVKIEKRNGEDVFYINKLFSEEEGYEEVESIYVLCLFIEANKEYREGYYWENKGRPIRVVHNFRDACCEEKVEFWFSRKLETCFSNTYNLYVLEDDKTGELITVCEDCFLERIGVEKRVNWFKYTYSQEMFYIYCCEGKPISAIRDNSPIWEKEKQVAKVIDYCTDNLGLKLKLEDVEYTDKYYKELVYNDNIAKEHQFYRVLSYKKLKKIPYYTKGKSKKEIKKEEDELKEFVRKSLNF